MKISILGAGGIGGYFGALLARNNRDGITFIARGGHLAAIQANGLEIYSRFGNFNIKSIESTDDLSSLCDAECIILSVKLWDLEDIVQNIRVFLRPKVTIIPLLNGVTVYNYLKETLAEAYIVPSVVSAGSELRAPGQIYQFGETARITISKNDFDDNKIVHQIITLFRESNIDHVLTESIYADIWSEFAFRVAFGGLTGVLRSPIGYIQEHTDAATMFQKAVEETLAVGAATGVAIEQSMRVTLVERMRNMSSSRTSAVLRALERGQRLDTPWMNGSVVKLGAQYRIPVPINSFIDTALSPHVMGK